jgi:glucosamine kinase
MICIVDSGSTKSDWVFVLGSERKSFSTEGLNPYFHTEHSVTASVQKNIEILKLASDVSQLFFYGAGCSSEPMKLIIKNGLKSLFVHADIVVDHDLAACAYSTYNGAPAISCIIGTGSNACFYDGSKFVQVVPALGYILGDEGSGTYIGKRIIRDYLYQRLPDPIQKYLAEDACLTKELIFDSTYRKTGANVFLASMVKLIYHLDDKVYLRSIAYEGFLDFLQNHVKVHENNADYLVHFVGSIAFLFQDELKRACAQLNVRTGIILHKPIDGLVAYHLRGKDNNQ